jgi:hypothetical protein
MILAWPTTDVVHNPGGQKKHERELCTLETRGKEGRSLSLPYPYLVALISNQSSAGLLELYYYCSSSRDSCNQIRLVCSYSDYLRVSMRFSILLLIFTPRHIPVYGWGWGND